MVNGTGFVDGQRHRRLLQLKPEDREPGFESGSASSSPTSFVLDDT